MHSLLKDWPHYLIEFLGTLFLVLIIGLGLGSGSPFVALSTGLGLMTLTYLGRPLSGAHYNPAITLALLINRFLSWQKAALYLLSQLLGATAGAGIAQLLVQDQAFRFVILPPGTAAIGEVLLTELLLTFFFGLVYLFMTRSEAHRAQPYYGLAIGSSYFVALTIAGDISGAVLNPALAFGPNSLQMAWIPMAYYWGGPLLGGSMAALLFRLLAPDDIPASTRKIKSVAQEVLEETEEAPDEEEEAVPEVELEENTPS